MRMKSAHNLSPKGRRGTRIATNVTLDSSLVAEARQLGLNISEASARGLQAAVAEARSEQWLRENGTALESSNAFVEANGLPLTRFRRF